MKSQPSVRTASQQCIVAWRPDLLGRAERSSPSAAKRRAGGAGLDGECAHRAMIPYARCAPSSDNVRGVEYRFLHLISTSVGLVSMLFFFSAIFMSRIWNATKPVPLIAFALALVCSGVMLWQDQHFRPPKKAR